MPELEAGVSRRHQQGAGYFSPITPIPPGAKSAAKPFAAALRRTVDELTHSAATASVVLQPNTIFRLRRSGRCQVC